MSKTRNVVDADIRSGTVTVKVSAGKAAAESGTPTVQVTCGGTTYGSKEEFFRVLDAEVMEEASCLVRDDKAESIQDAIDKTREDLFGVWAGHLKSRVGELVGTAEACLQGVEKTGTSENLQFSLTFKSFERFVDDRSVRVSVLGK